MNEHPIQTELDSKKFDCQVFSLTTNELKSILLLLGVGIGIRLLMLPLPGFRADMEWYVSLAGVLSKYGLLDSYSHQDEVSGQLLNYPPLALEVLWVLSPLVKLCELTSIKWLPYAIHRVLPIFADVVLSLLIYWMIRHSRINAFTSIPSKNTHWIGYWTMVLLLFNPGVLYAGVGYGQIDSVGALGIVSSLVTLHCGFPFLSGIFCGLAFGFKIQTIVFIPALLAITLYRLGLKACFIAGCGIVVSLLIPWLPFLLTGRGQQVWNCTFGINVNWRIDLTTGAFNLWSLTSNPLLPDRLPLEWLFDANGTIKANSIAAIFTYRRIGILLFTVGYAVVLAIAYLNRKLYLTDWWFLTCVGYIFFTVTTRIHERYLLYGLVFATPLIVTNPHWGRSFAYLLLTIAYLLNLLVIAPLSGNSPELSVIPLWLHKIGGGMVLCAGMWMLLPPGFQNSNRLLSTSRAISIWLFSVGISILSLYAIADYRTSTWRNDLFLQNLSFSESPTQSWDIPQRGVSVELRNPLTVDEIIWARGIGSHARSRLVFMIDGPATLHGAVGIDDQTLKFGRGELVASIRVNDVTVYQSEKIRSGDPAEAFVVELPNYQNKLELLAEPLETELDDHVDWLNLSIRTK